jgi:diguanylate cyclase (GGDEF)-like protein
MVDIIGRVGGEEFAILLPETTEQEAIRVAERLRQAIADAKISLGHGLPLSITVSIGITSLMSKDDNIDVLLSFADKALYAAKNAGRNRIFNIQDRIGSLVSQ